MSFPELFPSGPEYIAQNLVFRLKEAAMRLQKPEVFWTSLDEERTFGYQAYPLHREQESADITQLARLPLYIFMDAFNAWTVIRGNFSDEHTLHIDQYYVDGDTLSASVPVRQQSQDFDVSDKDDSTIDEIFDTLRQEAETADITTLPIAGPDANADLSIALHDLEPHIDLFHQEYYARRRQMTREDLLAERAAKYSWLVLPEIDKTKPAQWWILDTYAGLLYAVYANAPDIAAAIIDEYFEQETGVGGLPLPYFGVDPMEDEYVDRFDLQFGAAGKEFVRLIPFSRVPWPEDMANLTHEQQVALNALERPVNSEE